MFYANMVRNGHTACLVCMPADFNTHSHSHSQVLIHAFTFLSRNKSSFTECSMKMAILKELLYTVYTAIDYNTYTPNILDRARYNYTLINITNSVTALHVRSKKLIIIIYFMITSINLHSLW